MKRKKIGINNTVEQKMIDVDQQIPDGGTTGRLPVSDSTRKKLSGLKKDKVHIHLGNISKVVFKEELDKYLTAGYELGRATFSEDAINNIRVARKQFFEENPHGTNQTSGKLGQSSGNTGSKTSQETKQKISNSRIGTHLSEESKQLKIIHEGDTRCQNSGSVENSYNQAQEKRLNTLNELKSIDPDYNNRVQEKTKQTCLSKYGCEYVMQNPDVKNKGFETKIKRNNFCSSKREEIFYSLLLEKFDKDDIFRQYNKDWRYPFHCDFYIKSLDLFIELNLYGTHGSHAFDENNKNDILRLAKIKENQKLITLRNGKVVKNSYYQAEGVWTIADPLKQKTARDNNLNYMAIYKESEMYDFIRRL